MNKLLGCALTAFALGLPLAGAAQQTCRDESELPSSTPTSRFNNHGDGTVTDNGTGLMWARCEAEEPFGADADCAQGYSNAFNWQGALDYAAASELAGHTDWRLPNVSELLSIVEQRCFSPAINTVVFPNTPVGDFWSASPTATFSNSAWFVGFDYGNSYHYGARDGGLFGKYVRLVRAGQ